MTKILSIIFLHLAVITTAESAIITFDPPPLQNGQRGETNYLENGVLFSGSFAHTSTSAGFATNPSSGYIQLLFGDSLRFEMQDSSLFSLDSVDLAEYSSVFLSPKTITFTGFYLDGNSTSQSFDIDGFFGGLNDFETFSFDSSFMNLSYVEANTIIFSMDNLEINAVPEPSTLLLFSGALAGLVFFRQRKLKDS